MRGERLVTSAWDSARFALPWEEVQARCPGRSRGRSDAVHAITARLGIPHCPGCARRKRWPQQGIEGNAQDGLERDSPAQHTAMPDKSTSGKAYFRPVPITRASEPNSSRAKEEGSGTTLPATPMEISHPKVENGA